MKKNKWNFCEIRLNVECKPSTCSERKSIDHRSVRFLVTILVRGTIKNRSLWAKSFFPRFAEFRSVNVVNQEIRSRIYAARQMRQSHDSVDPLKRKNIEILWRKISTSKSRNLPNHPCHNGDQWYQESSDKPKARTGPESILRIGKWWKGQTCTKELRLNPCHLISVLKIVHYQKRIDYLAKLELKNMKFLKYHIPIVVWLSFIVGVVLFFVFW